MVRVRVRVRVKILELGLSEAREKGKSQGYRGFQNNKRGFARDSRFEFGETGIRGLGIRAFCISSRSDTQR